MQFSINIKIKQTKWRKINKKNIRQLCNLNLQSFIVLMTNLVQCL